MSRLNLHPCCWAQCVGVLAEALRGPWKPYAAALIEPMILTGLSPSLVDALQARSFLFQECHCIAGCSGAIPPVQLWG